MSAAAVTRRLLSLPGPPALHFKRQTRAAQALLERLGVAADEMDAWVDSLRAVLSDYLVSRVANERTKGGTDGGVCALSSLPLSLTPSHSQQQQQQQQQQQPQQQ